MFEKIQKDMWTAAKAKLSDEVVALRSLVNDIKNVAKRENREVTNDDVTTALVKAVKQREDSISQFTGRDDLIAAETFQLNVYKRYLPEQMSTEDVRVLVSETVERLANGAEKTKKLIGVVMKELNPILKGKADMKFVNQVLGELLN